MLPVAMTEISPLFLCVRKVDTIEISILEVAIKKLAKIRVLLYCVF